VDGLGWLEDPTEESLRAALTSVAPSLAARPMLVTPKVEQPNPLYWSGSAVVDGRFVVKFAWSEAPAARVWREGILLERLSRAEAGLPIPNVALVTGQPALLITDLVSGAPLSWEWASARTATDIGRIGQALGTFLAKLHALAVDPLLTDLPSFTPAPQGDTTQLRARYPNLVDDRRARLVLRWCDWVDATLGGPSSFPDVLVHGDLHGHNQLWDYDDLELVAVVDFEESGIAEPEFDLRYLPGNSRHPQLTTTVVDAYQRLTGHRLNLQRILAWNVRTHLGDALWRTEAHVTLPGGGDAASWVDDLAARFQNFGVEPAAQVS
jgi:aminoglycoside phosphotransferase (APT) family kinase protein